MKTRPLNAASLFHRRSSACQSPCVCRIPDRRKAFVGRRHTEVDPATSNPAFDVFSAWMVVIQTINFANPADPIRSVTEIKCLGPQYARRKSLSTNHLGLKEQQNATTRRQWKLLPGRSSSSGSMSRVKRTRVLTSGLTKDPASRNERAPTLPTSDGICSAGDCCLS